MAKQTQAKKPSAAKADKAPARKSETVTVKTGPNDDTITFVRAHIVAVATVDIPFKPNQYMVTTTGGSFQVRENPLA